MSVVICLEWYHNICFLHQDFTILANQKRPLNSSAFFIKVLGFQWRRISLSLSLCQNLKLRQLHLFLVTFDAPFDCTSDSIPSDCTQKFQTLFYLIDWSLIRGVASINLIKFHTQFDYWQFFRKTFRISIPSDVMANLITQGNTLNLLCWCSQLT